MEPWIRHMEHARLMLALAGQFADDPPARRHFLRCALADIDRAARVKNPEPVAEARAA